MMEMDLQINISTVDGIAVIDLTGEVDAYTCSDFRDKLIEVIDDGNPNLVVDMSEVEYIDSSGLGTLVGGLKRSSENKGKIALVCKGDQIRKVFEITGLERVFPIFESVQDAVDMLNNRA